MKSIILKQILILHLLLDGAETVSPEDVDAIPGCYDDLEAYKGEEHMEHEKMMAWSEGQGFKEYDPK